MRLYITIYVMFSSMRRISGRLWPALGVSALWGCPWHLGPSQWLRRETWSFLLQSPGRRTNTSAAHQTEKPNIDDRSQLFRARMTKALELALIYLSSSLLFRCFFWCKSKEIKKKKKKSHISGIKIWNLSEWDTNQREKMIWKRRTNVLKD